MAAFKPILGRKGRPGVLILGSMPSQLSLVKNQYYANPRNAFWWIMSELFDFDLTLDYYLRSEILIQAGISVWDVLYDCERPGSLDSAIVRGSEIPNDFAKFFRQNPSIYKVVFNGAAAETIFKRHHRSLIQHINQTQPDFEWHRCPSTSPAHASITKHDKLRSWRDCVI